MVETTPLCPFRSIWAKYLGLTLDGAARIAAVIQLPRTSFWAKHKKWPLVSQPNDVSSSRKYLTLDEVEHMIAAVRRAGGRLAERDALLITNVEV